MIKKIAIVFAVILALFLVDRVFFVPEREKNSRINRDIYIRFREIEDNCLTYLESEEGEQPGRERWNCLLVLDEASRCESAIDETLSGCYATEYYNWLESLGYSLPVLYSETDDN